MSVLAENRQQNLKDAFFNTTYAEKGLYAVKFWKNGKWREIIIDDRLPYRSERDRYPLFAHCEDPGELWVALMEKAYAKLHLSYAAIAGGFIAEGLQDLTGGVGMQVCHEAHHRQLAVCGSGLAFCSAVNIGGGGHPPPLQRLSVKPPLDDLGPVVGGSWGGGGGGCSPGYSNRYASNGRLVAPIV